MSSIVYILFIYLFFFAFQNWNVMSPTLYTCEIRLRLPIITNSYRIQYVPSYISFTLITIIIIIIIIVTTMIIIMIMIMIIIIIMLLIIMMMDRRLPIRFSLR